MTTTALERVTSYMFGEGVTRHGQVVQFSCLIGSIDTVKAFLGEHVLKIDVPVTGQVNVGHGGYGRYTRYDITQHQYAGGGPEDGGWGYIEVLEIKNSPEGRCGVVIHQNDSRIGSRFVEWDTLEDANAAFKKCWISRAADEELPKLKGFKRRVFCGQLTPWFYAVGDQLLIGDYAFPEGLQDDPVYTVGRKFVVLSEGVPSIKTCLGTRFIETKRQYHPYEPYHYRIVSWDDGTQWIEGSSESRNPPRPLEDGEEWIVEAMNQFRQLLAGKKTHFEVQFTDGHKFVGKVIRPNPKNPCAEGRYDLVVRIKGKEKPKEGWVDFKPTKKHPDIISFITEKLKETGEEPEHIQIRSSEVTPRGKKWHGAFFRRSPLSET